MSTQKPLAEDWFGYWDVRIRDPRLFTKIRTPDWASHAATQMAKEWIVSGADDFQVLPHLIPKTSLTKITFVRGESAGQEKRSSSNEGQVHARQGQLPNKQWVTQSVIIPENVLVEDQLVDLPPNIAHDIACYISRRLDKSDNVDPSPYCESSSR